MDSQDILDQYVTNRDGQVFAIKNLPGMVGAVMARYSRAATGLRETLLREFVKEDQLNPQKAASLIERVLIEYGDDSVGELEGAHLSFENISMLATKVIEHRRIGGSPIEQSTRYVRYDFRDPQTGYHYHHPRALAEEPAASKFREHMDGIFDAYATMWTPLVSFLEKRKPLEAVVYDLGDGPKRLAEMSTPRKRSAFRRTYKNDIKTKACDILRAFLPLATKANVGLFGNGRYFQYLISKMWTSKLVEANRLGDLALGELNKLIPHYVKRAQKLDYLDKNHTAMKNIADRFFPDMDSAGDDGILLIEPDHDFLAARLGEGRPEPGQVREALVAEENLSFLASLLYSFVRGSFLEIRQRLKRLSDQERQEILNAYYGERLTRRDRPERGIEHGYPYTFDLVTEWAVYKDLMRHRMGTVQVQPMAPDLGFEMPPEIEEAGLRENALTAIAHAENLFEHLSRNHPEEQEYALLQGHKIRWLLGMNDRALMHMLELRTTPQGHVNYRRACQELHRLAASRFPERARQMRFVNHEESYWAREASEARQRVKEEKLNKG